ncbi:MAG: Na+/Ca+ antiporter, CaCA family [Candidatus Peregrinibacteria bacterium GW2011_GWA2_47_7]|nr:MAG: Na+/Ca+ antiporter, CaCA family [Candidatus Peregrinibacteria bacterium GW2011_GWA2_47_7]
MTYLILIAGFAFLIKGADFLVSGSASLARRWGISSLAIGLTLVAFGTSTPELTVSFLASLSGASDISIGNVVGSNLANIALIIGFCAIVIPLRVQSSTVWKEIPFALLAMVVLGLIANDSFFTGSTENMISRADGIILLLFFVIFLYYVISLIKNGKENTLAEDEFKEEVKSKDLHSVTRSIAYVGLGLAGVVIGGKFVVDSASKIALAFGISEALVGLTIVAVGTSLPELATSAVAAFRKEADIAVGNIIGSNIFNIFFVLGVSSIPSPIPFNTTMNFDIIMVAIVTILLFVFAATRKKIERYEGILFVLLYVGYVIFIGHRG